MELYLDEINEYSDYVCLKDSCQTLRNTVLLIHVKLLLNHAMCVVVNMLIHVHCVGTGTLH